MALNSSGFAWVGINSEWDKYLNKEGKTSPSAPLEIREAIFIYKTSLVLPYLKILPGSYKTANHNVPYFCTVCKTKGFAKPGHLMNGHGCPVCMDNSRTKTLLKFKEDLEKVHEHKILATETAEYIKSYVPIEVWCTECLHIWSSEPRCLLSGYGCPACSNQDQNILYLAKERETGLIKIGVTKNLKNRMLNISSVEPFLYLDIGSPGAREEEKTLHHLFKDKRVTSKLAKCGVTEFFSLSKGDIEFIAHYLQEKYKD